MHPLQALETLEGYRRRFWDAALWAPYGLEACRQSGLPGLSARAAAVPGTCPVVLVQGQRECWVVKFYGRLFDGPTSLAIEREAARLLALNPAIQAPPLLAEGALFDGEALAGSAARPAWPWPYLIFGFVPGSSAGRGLRGIPAVDQIPAARAAGAQVRRIHSLPLAGSAVFPANWLTYTQFLDVQRAGLVERARAWASLPAKLADGIQNFLLPAAHLLDPGPAHLIHADLTGDHLLGRTAGAGWRLRGLIDFGDAMTGSLAYELGALRMDLFGALEDARGRALLAAFLDGYELPASERADLPHQALSAALLHRFDLFAGCTAARQAGSLEEMAVRLYKV